MSYRILAAKVVDDVIMTDVEYVFANGSVVVTVIPHFEPQSAADVFLGIENRFLSEDRKQLSAERNRAILLELPVASAEVAP